MDPAGADNRKTDQLQIPVVVVAVYTTLLDSRIVIDYTLDGGLECRQSSKNGEIALE
jgi:hypothetical protein